MSDVEPEAIGGLPQLSEATLDADPVRMFRAWLEAASATGMHLPEAAALATASADGVPSARMVLLRGLDERGFVFFTNYRSRKGRELEANPRAALLFYWRGLERQVRVEGRAEPVSPEESDRYFQQRPRGSRLAAIASPQSEVIDGRQSLDARVAELDALYPGPEVPRPAHWGGFRVVHESIEFWQGGTHRLHDRFRYRRARGGGWAVERLAP